MEPVFNMLVGLPGSGKSTYAKEWTSKGTVILSSDEIRKELWGDANDQQNPARVFEEMFVRAAAALNEGKDVVYDATNLDAKTRVRTLNRLRQAVKESFHAMCCVIVCSISECKRRQDERDRKVPDEVIDRMARKFESPWYNEGWDIIYVFSCGKMQNIDREHARMLGESHDNHHHTLTLGMHCNECVNQVKELLATEKWSGAFNERETAMLLEAAYQHDLGKHKTKAFLDSKGNPSEEAHFYSHNNVGAYLWLSGDKSNDWSRDEFLLIAQLIQWHMQPFFVCDKEGNYEDKWRAWCDKRNYKEHFCNMICVLHEADKRAH